MLMRTGKGILAGLLLLTLLLAASPASADCATDPCEAGCDLCAAGTADLCFFNSHETDPTQGVPVHFVADANGKIKYKINADNITAGLAKADVIAAVQAAFTAWENISCSTLAFEYAGESTSTTNENGMILVYWGNSASTWTHGDYIFYPEIYWTDYQTGEASWSTIGLNATPNHPQYKYDWSIGAAADKYDVQSMVTWLIPSAIGFDVSSDAGNTQIPICTNKEYRTLCDAHKTGAQLVYFDSADTTCTKPTVPNCQTTAPPGDGPPAGDGQPPTGDGQPPTGDGPAIGDGGVTGDVGGLPPGEDDGCCRVSHARTTSLPFVALLGLALLAVLGLTRRRRR
jgi:hypothetical protein